MHSNTPASNMLGAAFYIPDVEAHGADSTILIIDAFTSARGSVAT